MKYVIQRQIVNEPEIELPEGSLPVSVEHQEALVILGIDYPDQHLPELWEVVWLEPALRITGDKELDEAMARSL